MKDKIDLNQGYIPTIGEMQSWYEDDLRKEALKSSKYENNKKIEEQGAFLKLFEDLKKGIIKFLVTLKKNNVYYEKYRAYVEEETENKGKKIEEIENSIEYEKFFLRWERRVNSESNNYSHYGSNSATRYRVDCIRALEKELETILESSPEAWEFYYKRQ